MKKRQGRKAGNRLCLSRAAAACVIAAVALAAAFLLSQSRADKAGKGDAAAGAVSSVEKWECGGCNVIIVSITNARSDHFGYNGYFRQTSPNIDRLAERSLVFENAFSHASWTLPVGMSLFTSTYPFTHKVMDRYEAADSPGAMVETQLQPGLATLPEILRRNGYVTAAFTGGFDYNEQHGLVSRFDYSSYPDQSLTRPERYGTFDSNIENVTKWLRQNKGRKFLLFFQGFNVHCPFTYPARNDVFDPGYKGSVDFGKCMWTFDKAKPVVINGKPYYSLRTEYSNETGFNASVRVGEKDIYHMVALYDGELQHTDRLLKGIFDEVAGLGLEENTVIVLLSEHGDMFGKHGRFMRGGPLRGTLYDDVIHIPLLIRHPSLEPKRISGLVQVIDIAPTLLDFLGIPKEESFEGKSLLPLIADNKTVNDFVMAGSVFTPAAGNMFFNETSVVAAIRTKDFKLISEELFDRNLTRTSVSYEFYNLSADPEELNNIYPTTNSSVAEDFKKKTALFTKKVNISQH